MSPRETSLESELDNASSARASFSETLEIVRRQVDRQLGLWLEPRLAAAAGVSAEVLAAAQAIEGLALRGGKRMRAALIAAAFDACSAEPTTDAAGSSWASALPAMVAIELLQVYLLIHDDWMDDDDVRRGGPAVHIMLRERLGDVRLGDAAAILAGDLASGYAQSALLECPVSADRLLRAAQAFARIQEDVVTGQLAEMSAVRAAQPPSVELIHSLKTASYTVTGPLALGAVLAGADDARVAEFGRFGRPLGIAFQLRDDLLGVFGDPTATGKPIWNDIRQGKRTALVTELRGSAEAEALLARVLGNPDAPSSEIEAVVRLMETSGARARVEARVQELLDETRQVLASMNLRPSLGRRVLQGAISALGERAS
ncbi:Octaprenyl diphosphate synthase [Labilithrix luteola]|uniref:Octaprenyl diphosphate synthase n=1 Tax=Labilithrix luteola TaxID=1391654 RepID=A0A0K1Q723_9BACT|nr:polyprenyl synthetase family protein [Labilithrix luteola]AKV01631.1 Octaprenyl diphosphate synthase [Labilithrix luteola]